MLLRAVTAIANQRTELGQQTTAIAQQRTEIAYRVVCAMTVTGSKMICDIQEILLGQFTNRSLLGPFEHLLLCLKQYMVSCRTGTD